MMQGVMSEVLREKNVTHITKIKKKILKQGREDIMVWGNFFFLMYFRSNDQKSSQKYT